MKARSFRRACTLSPASSLRCPARLTMFPAAIRKVKLPDEFGTTKEESFSASPA
jgi:hypothetical protein